MPPLRHIVLAEDNPADVALVRLALDRHDVSCDLRVLKDGELAMTFIQGLDLDAETPCPDLILLDLHLPKRSGDEVLRHFRATGKCATTPVIFLTGSDAPADRSKADADGAVHYFFKPASFEGFMKLGTLVKELIPAAGDDSSRG